MTTLEKLLQLERDNKLIGLHEGITNEVYHHKDSAGVSKSGLDLVHRSYAHYKYKQENKQEKTKAMIFGSAVHTKILEPELFNNDYVVAPEINRRTKDGKLEWLAFETKNVGKEILTVDEMDTITAIYDKFNAHSTCKNLMEGAQFELSGWFQLLGILGRFRPDIYKAGEFIADIKTTQDASINEFRRAIVKYSYDKQAAFYQDGIKSLTGLELPFYFIAIEKNPPHEIAIYQASQDDIEVGRELYTQDVQKLVNAITFGDDGYPLGIRMIDMPHWGHDLSNR
jgi:hypothetical protein